MKYNRHAKILELIDNYDIETQDELVESLRSMAWMLLKPQYQEILKSYVL